MATYEIGDKSARIIWQALDFYWWRFPNTKPRPPELNELLELFAPPKPPTAEELAEALRTALYQHEDKPRTDARDVLKRWDKAQS